MAAILFELIAVVIKVAAELAVEVGVTLRDRPGSSEQERDRNPSRSAKRDLGASMGLSAEQQRHRNPNRSAKRDLGASMGLSAEEAARQRRLAIHLAAVMLDVARADGTLDPMETEEALRGVWDRLDLPPEDRRAVDGLFREALVQAPRADAAARELASELSEAQRAAVTEGLYRVAAADGAVHRAERARLRQLCELLKVPEATRRTAVSRALGSVALCYELLDVSPDVSDLQLKEAYLRRSMEVTGELEQGQVEAAYQELRILRGMG